jgi:hypothetical protein
MRVEEVVPLGVAELALHQPCSPGSCAYCIGCRAVLSRARQEGMVGTHHNSLPGQTGSRLPSDDLHFA